jgi:hypothetical protein
VNCDEEAKNIVDKMEERVRIHTESHALSRIQTHAGNVWNEEAESDALAEAARNEKCGYGNHDNVIPGMWYSYQISKMIYYDSRTW